MNDDQMVLHSASVGRSDPQPSILSSVRNGWVSKQVDCAHSSFSKLQAQIFFWTQAQRLQRHQTHASLQCARGTGAVHGIVSLCSQVSINTMDGSATSLTSFSILIVFSCPFVVGIWFVRSQSEDHYIAMGVFGTCNETGCSRFGAGYQ